MECSWFQLVVAKCRDTLVLFVEVCWHWRHSDTSLPPAALQLMPSAFFTLDGLAQ